MAMDYVLCSMRQPPKSGVYTVRCGVSKSYFKAYWNKTQDCWYDEHCSGPIVFGTDGRKGIDCWKKNSNLRINRK